MCYTQHVSAHEKAPSTQLLSYMRAEDVHIVPSTNIPADTGNSELLTPPPLTPHPSPHMCTCRYGMRGFWARDAKPVVLTRDKIDGIHLTGTGTHKGGGLQGQHRPGWVGHYSLGLVSGLPGPHHADFGVVESLQSLHFVC